METLPPTRFNNTSLHGRITFVVFFLIANFTAFSIYVWYETNRIRQTYNAQVRHASPAHLLTSHAANTLTVSMHMLQQGMITHEMPLEEAFAVQLDKYLETMRTIKGYCDSMDIAYQDAFDSAIVASNRYREHGTAIFTLLKESRDSTAFAARYGGAAVDSLIRLKYHSWLVSDYGRVIQLTYDNSFRYSTTKDTLDAQLRALTTRLLKVISISAAVSLVISLAMWFRISRHLRQSIRSIISVIQRTARGQLVKEAVIRQDEVGQVIEATNALVDNLQNVSSFASQIGKGDFSQPYVPASEEDTLGKALVTMRDELKKFQEEDQKRLWTNEGFASFGEILRNEASQVTHLSSTFIAALVNYLRANQGALFVINQEGEDRFLEMTGCYAYSRKKYLSCRILPGEGLVGQAYLEKDYLYLTEIPEDYVRITSGLGEATPRAVLIMPLLMEGRAMGVIELASFQGFEPYQIEFVRKIGENLAAVLATVKNNEKNQGLLRELQEKTSLMSSQEEELRQNMEELEATQEELMRKEKEYRQTIHDLEQTILSLKGNDYRDQLLPKYGTS